MTNDDIVIQVAEHLFALQTFKFWSIGSARFDFLQHHCFKALFCRQDDWLVPIYWRMFLNLLAGASALQLHISCTCEIPTMFLYCSECVRSSDKKRPMGRQETTNPTANSREFQPPPSCQEGIGKRTICVSNRASKLCADTAACLTSRTLRIRSEAGKEKPNEVNSMASSKIWPRHMAIQMDSRMKEKAPAIAKAFPVINQTSVRTISLHLSPAAHATCNRAAGVVWGSFPWHQSATVMPSKSTFTSK